MHNSIKTIKERNLEKEIEVINISHIGGHKYAGNLIIYPGGHWYGRVTTCHVESIMDNHLNKGIVLKPLLRGQIQQSF